MSSQGGGGGYSEFLYIRMLGYFFVFKILISIFFGVFKKKNLGGGGYEDFMDIFLGHHKFGLYLGVISMHFRVFS